MGAVNSVLADHSRWGDCCDGSLDGGPGPAQLESVEYVHVHDSACPPQAAKGLLVGNGPAVARAELAPPLASNTMVLRTERGHEPKR